MELMGPRLDERFCTSTKDGLHSPFGKQLLWLAIDDLEALYGGAAGGGKSDALLMAGLQYIDQPHYRAITLRRKAVDLVRSDAILARAKEWWLPTRRTGVQYNAGEHKFIFPSGATWEFGHCQNVGDERENYQGGAWQFISFDELTQFEPPQYTYLFSRLRRTKSDEGLPDIPLRVRSTSNPGGPGHNFVRDRFMSMDFAKAFLAGVSAPSFCKTIKTPDGDFRRWFVPSKSIDNLAMDVRSYNMGLSQLDPLERERLKEGNWLINESGRFKPEWFSRYEIDSAGYYHLLKKDGTKFKTLHERECERIIIVDPAGTEKEVKREQKGKQPCFSAISVFDVTPDAGYLLWRNVTRLQGEFPEVIDAIVSAWREWRPTAVYVERDGIGRPYYQHLEHKRLPVSGLDTGGKDKLVRASPAANEAKEGRVFLPEYAGWLDECEAELFAWQGTSDEVCDQIDTLAWAAKLKVDGSLGSTTVLQ